MFRGYVEKKAVLCAWRARLSEAEVGLVCIVFRVQPGYTSEHFRSCRVALIAIEYVISVI